MEQEKKELTTAEARLHLVDEERKTLKKQVKDERELRLEKAAKMREGRDEKIEKIQEKLGKITGEIYAYNKLGKVAKIECDILTKIAELTGLNIESQPALIKSDKD